MKHTIGPPATESAEQREQRVAFETWMKENYADMILEIHPNSGYYRVSTVNACWEIWLHLCDSAR